MMRLVSSSTCPVMMLVLVIVSTNQQETATVWVTKIELDIKKGVLTGLIFHLARLFSPGARQPTNFGT